MTDPKKSDKSLKEIEVEVEEVKAASLADNASADVSHNTEASQTTDGSDSTDASDPTESSGSTNASHSTEASHSIETSDSTNAYNSAEASHFDISEINFLPLVVADQTLNTSNENLDVDDHKIPKEVPKAIQIDRDEISSDPMDEDLQGLINEIIELDFLPVVIDDEMKLDTELPDAPNAAASEFLENIEGYSLSDFEVSFEEKNDAEVCAKEEIDHVETSSEEEVNPAEGHGKEEKGGFEVGDDEEVDRVGVHCEEEVDRNEGHGEEEKDKVEVGGEGEIDGADAGGKEEKVEFDLEDAPIDTKISNGEDVMSWLMADNELREIELNYETVPYPTEAETPNHLIPEPVYYDDHEAYMMGLLDDLEELGDLREIPLLEELRAEESKSFIKERITGMIEKFSLQKGAKRKESPNTDNEAVDLPVFSVFADLFKTIDTECKLILLDEIVPVGDEKEIEFLDGLLESPDQRIRTKAQTVLRLLIAKLSHENPEALCTKGISDIVAEYSDSEIAPEKGVDQANLEEENYGQLLSELEVSAAMSPEIFDIDFELCEVLDKNYEQKILDIPVIATEVSSNDNGGSFFNSLRKFSKLF